MIQNGDILGRSFFSKAFGCHNISKAYSRVGVPFFGHMTQGFSFCYLLNTTCTWNKFKCENLDNSNHEHSYGGGDFSHAYVITHQ